MKTYSRKSRGRQKYGANLNFDLICRLCLSEDGEMQDLFQEEESTSPRIPVQIMSSLSIAVYENDLLPTQICCACIENVQKYYVFKQRCEESDATLRKTLKIMREEDEVIDVSPSAEDEVESAEPVNETVVDAATDEPTEKEVDENCSLECPNTDDPQTETPCKSMDELLMVCEKRSHDMENAAIEATSDGRFIIHVDGEEDSCEAEVTEEFSIMIKSMQGESAGLKSSGHLGDDGDFEMGDERAIDYEGDQDDDAEDEEPQIIRKQVKLEPSDGSDGVVYTFTMNQAERVTSQKLTYPFQCLHCPKRFLKRIDLRRHLSVHQDKKGWSHVPVGFDCETCDKWFPNATTLKRHERSHTGERPFSCDRCGKAFSQAGILHRHSMTHTGEKPFACTHCGKGFTQREGMKVHMRSHGPKNPDEIVLHECPLCEKSFCHPSGLSRHLLVHTGKTFNCKFCAKVFTDPSSLRRHERRHEDAALQGQLSQ